MLLEFVRQSDRNDSNTAANAARLVNCYPETLPEGSLARHQLRAALGTATWGSVSGVFVRALTVVEGTLYAIAGGNLQSVNSVAATAVLGAVGDGENATLSSNDGDVTAVVNNNYFVWDGSTLTEPSTGAFSEFGSVEYVNGYTVLTEAGGKRLQWSALYNAASLPGLNFGYADASEGSLLRGVAVNGNLLLFKEKSTELWTTTGLANENAFARLGGVALEIGLKDFGLVAKTPNAVVFVASDNTVRLTTGGTDMPIISTPAVSEAIATSSPASVFYHEAGDHKFVTIRFAGRPAWVCDLSEGYMWHERAWGEDGAYPVTATAYAYGYWVAAGPSGAIWRLRNTYTDVDGPLIRRATSYTIFNGRRFRVRRLQMQANVGESDLGREATINLLVSRDGGKTWPIERDVPAGDLGDYSRTLKAREFGQFERFTAEVRVTDPTGLSLLTAAILEAS